MLAALLTREGYRVETTGTAREALALAQAKSYDLLILDLKLPDGDGTQLCEQIRDFDPYTPIIIYSGMVRDADREAAGRAKRDAFVAKPEVDILLSTIKSFLD